MYKLYDEERKNKNRYGLGKIKNQADFELENGIIIF
jgi:hypothetical protein